MLLALPACGGELEAGVAEDDSMGSDELGTGPLLDVMAFFLPDPAKFPNGNRLLATDGSSISTTRYGNAIFRVKWGASSYEHWTYDSNFIYLKYDRTWGRQPNCADAYEFAGNNGMGGKWLKRRMRQGETVSQVVSLRQYDARCHVVAASDHGYYTTLEKLLPKQDLGALGKADVIQVKYSGNGNVPFERFYFARGLGWIGWDFYDRYGATTPKHRVRWTKGYTKSPVAPVAACVPIPTKPLPAPPALGCGRLKTCQSLGQGEAVKSCDGRFRFILQNDGNLVLYQGTTPLWNSHTNGQDGHALEMQPDGNLVIYSSAGQALWSAGTWTHANATLAVQNDGNAVIYDGAAPVWATGTWGH